MNTGKLGAALLVIGTLAFPVAWVAYDMTAALVASWIIISVGLAAMSLD